MPIQWSGVLSGPQQLAGVIQGEAGTAAGQFAVASVMYNRLQNGGFGSSLLSVVTPNNFNGYNSSPSPYAQQLANDLWSGNAPSGGSTGNALYFAAPSSSNAAWANPSTASGQGLFGAGGNNIGGNYYSDVQGPPTSNFQAPQYGGTQTASTEPSVQPDAPSDTTAEGDDPLGWSVTEDPNGQSEFTSSGSGGIGSDAVAGGTATASGGSGGIGSDAVASGTASTPATDSQPFNPQTASVPGLNAPANATPAATVTAATNPAGQGQPIAITSDQPEINAANTVGKSITGAGQSVTTAAGQLTNAGTSWLDSIYAVVQGFAISAGLVLLGLVLLLGAFAFFYIENQKGGSTTIVPVPA